MRPLIISFHEPSQYLSCYIEIFRHSRKYVLARLLKAPRVARGGQRSALRSASYPLRLQKRALISCILPSSTHQPGSIRSVAQVKLYHDYLYRQLLPPRTRRDIVSALTVRDCMQLGKLTHRLHTFKHFSRSLQRYKH